VISGPLFYCNLDAPYEYRIGEDEPQGYQTDEELYIFLTRIVAGEILRGDENTRGNADAHHDPTGWEAYDARIHQKAVDEAHPKP
jgi:hypothetical protein